ncbi:response regulator [Paenibacillus monticola]|uniref:Response regulator n=1 Tax=Paenibacillus monticola TaxID=2666075 RepID=A0A7X2HA09_9BACL|nr:response regulator [Paenibacillus monticola]
MSINVLLVDDEAVDLEWLRRRVLASELDIQVAGTANSGFLALKVMEEERIDIILSDIRMPIMTGIEFARKAKAVNPNVKIVFISGHEDFSYAKEAIQINASGYLLKPVEDKDLYEMLRSLCEKMEQEREKDRSFTEALSLVNEELLLRWFDDEAPGPAESHLRSVLDPLLLGGSAVAIVEIDDLEWKLRDLSEEESRIKTRQIALIIKSFATEAKLGTLIAAYPTRFVILSAIPKEPFLNQLEELIQKVAKASAYTVTVGVGRYAYDDAALHESYRLAEAALSAKWLLGKNRLIRDTMESSPRDTRGGRIDTTVGHLLEAIIEYDLVAIDDHLLELFNGDMPVARKKDVYELIVRITSNLHAALQQQNENLYEILQWELHQPDILFQFETIHDILSWLRRRFFELSELLYVKRQRQKRKLIDEIMRYVEENLEKKITLKEVAAHFDFTPNYLGFLFKEETKVPFSDYVNERKTNSVCELLTDPTLKIYEIAERMGYKNMIYFNRQFKQTTGMTPGEFRKKNKI